MKSALTFTQQQSLQFSQRMHRALHILQTPQQELELLIEQELILNPLLETESKNRSSKTEPEEQVAALDFSTSSFSVLQHLDENFTSALFPEEEAKESLADLFSKAPTAQEKLKEQIFEAIPLEKQSLVLLLLEHIDERGFFTADLTSLANAHNTSATELKTALSLLQELDPPGIGAQNPHQALLLQLRRKSREKSLAYRILSDHFEDLLCRRTSKIAQKCHTTEEMISEIISKEIAPLSPFPLSSETAPTPTLTPDATIEKIEEHWHIGIGQDRLPKVFLSPHYDQIIEKGALPEEERKQLARYLEEGKLLLRSLERRRKTLLRITTKILEKNYSFFNSESSSIAPLSMTSLADTLELHPSTISRAIDEKWISTPRGLLPFSYFFSSSVENAQGLPIATQAIKEKIQTLLKAEESASPLSDEAISAHLAQHGILCARRTVAKYRDQLAIPSARFRKKP